MIEHIKLAAKIGARTFLKWLLLVAAGCILSLSCAAIIVFKNRGLSSGDGSGNSLGYVLSLFSKDTTGFILLFGAPVFIILYFLVVNKIIIANTIYLVLKHKAGAIISTQVGRLVDGLTTGGTWVAKGADAAILRAKLLQANMDDPNTSRLKRGVIKYGFNKIRLDDIDLRDGNMKLSTIVVGKVDHLMRETAKPSLKLFWLLVFVQLGLLAWSISG